jgi:hypothetical protein
MTDERNEFKPDEEFDRLQKLASIMDGIAYVGKDAIKDSIYETLVEEWNHQISIAFRDPYYLAMGNMD